MDEVRRTAVAPSSDHSVNEFIKYSLSTEQVIEKYKSLADNYHKDFTPETYQGPQLAADALLRMYPEDGPIPRSQLKVMDIAAGTGLVGRLLYDAGIRHLDAIDASAEMLAIARERGIYSRIIEDTIGDHRIDVEDDTYDAAIIAGGFCPAHCPLTTFEEMLRICKPGGYVVNAMRYEFLVTALEFHGLEKHLDALEQAGKWRRVDRYVTDSYFGVTKQGITHIYQKL